jgi:hypothetical protein
MSVSGAATDGATSAERYKAIVNIRHNFVQALGSPGRFMNDDSDAFASSHTILFWNVHKTHPGNLILDLCKERNVDTVLIAEGWREISSFGLELSELQMGGYLDFTGTSTKIQVFSRLPFSAVEPKADAKGVTIKLVKPPTSSPFLLAAVHLPSKMYYKGHDQLVHTRGIIDLIRDVERDIGIAETLVIGDFNMDPFEPGMTAAGAFHAVMDRSIALRKARTINGVSFPFFYNPMWSRLGDANNGPPGTFRRAGSTYLEYFWRTFDQVLLAPQLLHRVPDSSIEVIHTVGSFQLITQDGRWRSPSDHLPLLVSIS